jgi:hypothetical protein
VIDRVRLGALAGDILIDSLIVVSGIRLLILRKRLDRGQTIPAWASSILKLVGKLGPFLFILVGLLKIAKEIYDFVQ